MITDIRLACQQLSQPQFEAPEDLVDWMGAIQAQDYAMSKWAVGLRLKSATVGQINQALAQGEIVRTHIMRPTWHWIAGKNLRWMRQLTGERVKKVIDSWVKGSGLDIPESLYTKCNDLIGRILSGRHCLTREEIEVELKRNGVSVADERGRCYILRAETEGIICSGGDKGGKPTYALLEEQVAPVAPLHREEALARLAIGYFRSHSPATLQDFVWWSGLTVSEAKQAVGLIKGELVTERWNDREFWVYATYKPSHADAVFHFLPSYDEYLIAYKDRTTVMAAEHHPKAFNRRGIFYPVILDKGRIVGNWTKMRKKDKITIMTSLFDPGSKVHADRLREAELQYRRFMGDDL